MTTREEALAIVREYVKNESLVRHMLAVEAAVRWYARKLGEDEERWGLVALLHDFDWEIHPDLERHPQAGAPILRERGIEEEIIEDILSHADHTGVPRDTPLRKALAACDELTGLITATALVRPSKDIRDVEVKSVHEEVEGAQLCRRRQPGRDGRSDRSLWGGEMGACRQRAGGDAGDRRGIGAGGGIGLFTPQPDKTRQNPTKSDTF